MRASFTCFCFSQTKLQLLARLLRDQLQNRALAEQTDADLPNRQTIREERHELLHVIKTNSNSMNVQNRNLRHY